MLKASYFDTENTTPENRETLKRHLKTILDEGQDYYEQLLTDLSENFVIDLERCYDVLEPRYCQLPVDNDTEIEMYKVSPKKTSHFW